MPILVRGLVDVRPEIRHLVINCGKRTVLVCKMEGGKEFPFDTSKSIKRGCTGE